jgi:hypothetical protein
MTLMTFSAGNATLLKKFLRANPATNATQNNKGITERNNSPAGNAVRGFFILTKNPN